MKFDTKINFTDSDKYIGQPLVLVTAQGGKFIFTVIEKHRLLPKDEFNAMYIVSLTYNWIHKRIEDLSIMDKDTPTTFRHWTFGHTAILRTPTVEEYRTYKKILREQVIYDKWI